MLRGNRNFMLLLGGAAVSKGGTAITYIAFPYIALTVLGASEFEVSLLVSLNSLAFLLLALPAGVIVDRNLKKPLMVWADVGRAVLVGSVPLAAAFDVLTLAQLYVAALLAGALTVFFEVAHQSYVPAVVAPEHLMDANGKLQTVQSVSSVLAPTLGGSLLTIFGATRMVVADAVSYVVSAVFLLMVEVGEEKPKRVAGTGNMREETRQGLSFVFRHHVLRMIVACTATSNLFGAMYFAVEMIFFVRELEADAFTIGLIVSAGGLGGVLGGLFAQTASRIVGSARMIWVSIVCLGWTGVLVPLARPGWTTALAAFGLFGFSMTSVLYNTAQLTYRQRICPPDLLGRVNASVRWVVWGTLPLGGVLGGVLASAIGVRETLLLAGLGGWLAGLWVLLSPVRHMRDIPEPTAPVKTAEADSP